MVDAMIANLPNVTPYASIRRDLTTQRHIDQKADEAKHDLDKLILLITEEIQTEESLHNKSKTGHDGTPREPKGQTMGLDNEFKAAVLKIAAQYSGAGGQRKGLTLDESIIRQCKSYLDDRCIYGDKCKYGHFNTKAADPRVQSGKLLPHCRKAIEDESARLRAERNNRNARGQRNGRAKENETILSLIAGLQETLANLKK